MRGLSSLPPSRREGPAAARSGTSSPRPKRRRSGRSSISGSCKRPKRARQANVTKSARHMPSHELVDDMRSERKITKPKRNINLNKPSSRKRKRKRSSQRPITRFFNTNNPSQEAQSTDRISPSKRPRINIDSPPRIVNVPAPKGSECLGANFPT